jgi:6-phosphogluconolactonase
MTPVEGSPFPTGYHSSSIAVDPKAEFVYVVNPPESTISAYRIDQKSGALTQVTGSPFPTGVTPLAIAITR